MSLRIGIDAVPLGRIRKSLERHERAFMSKLLTPDEVAYCAGPRKIERVAGRVAAKEAVMKVLGEGWPAVSWTEVEVLPGGSGRPAVALTGKARQVMGSLGLAAIDVSITHDGDLAIAVALGVPGADVSRVNPPTGRGA
jgi:phosphopantetheine--protein transferase-like protein